MGTRLALDRQSHMSHMQLTALKISKLQNETHIFDTTLS